MLQQARYTQTVFNIAVLLTKYKYAHDHSCLADRQQNRDQGVNSHLSFALEFLQHWNLPASRYCIAVPAGARCGGNRRPLHDHVHVPWKVCYKYQSTSSLRQTAPPLVQLQQLDVLKQRCPLNPPDACSHSLVRLRVSWQYISSSGPPV